MRSLNQLANWKWKTKRTNLKVRKQEQNDAVAAPNQSRLQKQLKATWKKVQFFPKVSLQCIWSTLLIGFLITRSPFELWKFNFLNDVLSTIVEKNNLFARRDKNNHNFEVSTFEICCFLDILLLSGFYSVPYECDFWSNQCDLGVPVLSEALSSKCYLKIKFMFHVVGNQTLISASSKIAKVLPLYNSLNALLVQFDVFHKPLHC